MNNPTILKLNDSRSIPQLGLGVWRVSDGEASQTVQTAVKAGYRLIDTATAYQNERGIGDGVRAAGVPREDIFVTTKLWNGDHDAAETACEASLKRLGLDYVDLYLIHWPSPAQNKFVQAWKSLIKLKEQGKAKSIGVSNFRVPDLERIIGETGVTPVLNQIELHPHWPQAALREFHAKNNILTEAWSPLGQGKLLDDPELAKLGKKHGKTPAQIVLRWHMQNGVIAIPKSTNPGRIVENIAVFDFTLDAGDMAAIAALEQRRGRIGPDPGSF